MKKVHLICFVLLAGFSVNAETRTWTDREGNRYEADFVREMFDKVTLRDIRGKELRFAVEDLSENDQKYIRVMVPPEFVIEFSKKVEPKPKPWDLYDSDNDTTFLVSATVEFHKKSKRPFTSRLNAELFLIAKEYDGKNYVLLGKTDLSFLFDEKSGGIYVMKADPVEVSVFTEYNKQRRGWEYLGYLVVVSDASGNIVQVSTDIDWLGDKVENLREIYMRGNASIYSRFFDKENVRKIKAPRPVFYTPRQR